MRIRNLLFIVFCLAFCGCNPCRYYASRCAPVESRVDSIWSHDTVIFERIVTDTLIYATLPHETAEVFAPDTATAETSLAFARAYLNAGQIILKLANKPQAPLQVPKITERTHHKTDAGQQTTITQKVTVYRTRPIVKFLASVGGIAIALLLVLIIFKICKRFISKI